MHYLLLHVQWQNRIRILSHWPCHRCCLKPSRSPIQILDPKQTRHHRCLHFRYQSLIRMLYQYLQRLSRSQSLPLVLKPMSLLDRLMYSHCHYPSRYQRLVLLSRLRWNQSLNRHLSQRPIHLLKS
jgi:hypothetical protein